MYKNIIHPKSEQVKKGDENNGFYKRERATERNPVGRRGKAEVT
jgi:hypothetical protein